ncbi:MAG: STAS domain-containing protein [Candidatus Riflebacteria bacterium]|nr:STAS domain-containing protein [Candidatus Riflebacteria bacterium]
MKFNVRKEGKISIVALSDQVNASNSIELTKILKNEISEGCKFIVLDFSKTTLIDSSGISAILVAQNKISPVEGKILISGCSNSIMKIFILIGFKNVFDFFTTVPEALSSISPEHLK